MSESVITQYEIATTAKEKIMKIELKAHVVDDLCGNPNTGICRRLHNSAQLSHSSKVGGSLLDSCGRSIGLSRGLSVNIGLRLRVSGSESVFESLGVVDDLGGRPNISCRNNLD